MPPKDPFLLYLRSRLSVALALAGAALVLLCVALLRERSLLAVLGILAAYAVATVVVFFSARGARAVVKEKEEDQKSLNRRKIACMEEIRERISVLRLGDEDMSAAIEYFLQESGSYLEKCRELESYSPAANESIERVLEVCQVFLGERDEESTGRRYRVADVGGTAGRQPVEASVRDILDCARRIKEKTVEDVLGGSVAERLEIKKELDQST